MRWMVEWICSEEAVAEVEVIKGLFKTLNMSLKTEVAIKKFVNFSYFINRGRFAVGIISKISSYHDFNTLLLYSLSISSKIIDEEDSYLYRDTRSLMFLVKNIIIIGGDPLEIPNINNAI